MRKTIGHLCVAAAVALAGPASAADLFANYGFTLASGTNGASVPGGLYFTSTSSSGTAAGQATLGVTISAWNMNTTNGGSSYAVSTASLQQYEGGLGAISNYDTLGGSYNIVGKNENGTSAYYTNVSCSSAGSCLTHQVDNQGNKIDTTSRDLIQLVFDRDVILNTVGTDAFGLISGATVRKNNTTYNKLVYDDDFSFGTGSALSTGTLNSGSYNALWDGFVGDNGACTVNDTASGMGVCASTQTVYGTPTTSLASKVWYISAGAALANQSGADAIADAFKLNNITVYQYVKSMVWAPEPSTWGMMVLGFGAIGVSIRRRKADERKAALAA
jgi:hypothetical protein